MSFASFASGSNEVVATSIAASIAELIISAISTNAIASSSAISSSFATPIADRGDQHDDRDGEVDPHVPLRAEHVDDPLERVVEALEEVGGRRLVTRSTVRSSRASISAPWS